MIKISKNSEDFSFEEIENKLLEYKQNLSQIESILEREREKHAKKDLKKIKLEKRMKLIAKIEK